MDAQEKIELIENLRVGCDTLLSTVSGITEERAARVPAPGRWSVLECVEHIVLAEDHMFAKLVSAERSEQPLVNTRREAAIRQRGPDRSTRVEAPDAAKPRGSFASLQEAVQHFMESRARTIEFVAKCDEDFRAMLAIHPLFGRINGYEMLLLIAAHPYRHAKQIEEVLASLD